jgi:hypothetical protein
MWPQKIGGIRRDPRMGSTANPEHDEKGGTVGKLTVLEAYREGKLPLPPGYGLEFDADMILLRDDNGAIVAAFGVADNSPSGVTKSAWEDYTQGRNNPA